MEQFEQYDKGKFLRDRYIKVSDISEGSYGLVSVAKDTKRKDLLVAVKFIYPVDYKKRKDSTSTSITNKRRPSSSPARLKSPQIGSPNKHQQNSIFTSLLNEAQKEIKIHEILGSHPHISQLYDHFDSCLILEFCSRGDLYEAIHNGNGPVTTQDLKDVFQQILNAVEFCHSKGVYHRDLKPENILIAEDWSIKLCDWGLATTNKFISNKDEFDIGSERYMAPELFDNEIESYDASKIDIWSIGIILLTLVFHKNPFQVANYSDKRFLQFASNREALFDIFSTMSGDLFSVLRFCLTIDPDNRDLKNVSEELDALRFFTIDEEYDASDYEEEDEEEDNYISYDEVEEKNRLSNVTVPSSQSSSVKSTNGKIDDIGSSSNSDKSNSPPDSQYEIPHNHRADALLSTNTKAKPIPINTHDFKFIRNTRKPLNVASFNQVAIMNRNGYTNSHNNNNNNNSCYNNKLQNFNREDYFTPKSVFNHYMDKYGEKKRNPQLNGNINGNGTYDTSNNNNNYKKPPLRRKRTWKANQNRYKQNGAGQHHHHKSVNGRSSHHEKFNNSYNQNGGTTILNGNVKKNGNLSSTYHPLPHPSSFNGSASSGKYIPPNLRSPVQQPHQRSPLLEEMDNLSLGNGDEEVFHLEDDFETSESNKNSNSIGDSTTNDIFSMYNNNGGNRLDNGNGPKGSIKALKASPTQGISNSKYIPPFRRASISRTNNITGSLNNNHLQPQQPQQQHQQQIQFKNTFMNNDNNNGNATTINNNNEKIITNSFDDLYTGEKIDWSDY
ncbi:KSP2 [Candida jiufengensis]|uniref:KSP2 n=1 Tax=Candida jiufengensis TaxID=497108 RepID=UPI002224DAB6|nr:KSP2 [Candida jiufengensis]KAI5951956.1 KSP2 [Candida jiufengensis]